MLNSLTEALMTTGGGEITNMEIVLSMLTAVGLGMIIALIYLFTHKESAEKKSFAMTLVMIPVILAVIILFVGSNIARAFSLAGVLSIIRFRSAPGDVKDIGYIFFSTAIGIGCGVGMYLGSALFVGFMSIVLLLLEKLVFCEKGTKKNIKILMPEDLNFENAFDEVFEKYTTKHILNKIKTSELGSIYEMHYQVEMKKNISEKEFIDELRTRNGNLSIMLTLAA